MDLEFFKGQMAKEGICTFPEFMPHKLVGEMHVDIEKAYHRCRAIQLVAGLDHTENTVHHLIGQEKSFLYCLSEYERLDEYIEEYFQGKYILNAMGGNILKSGESYASNIHRDQRSFSGELPLMLNTIVMLDDFTKKNGATWLMEGGHRIENVPSEREFKNKAFQILGKAGTVVMFDSNLWHRAGENRAKEPRRSLTPMFSKPFYKPQFDYPRVLGYDLSESFSPYLRQVLGYESRIPASLQEWYKLPEQRFYKRTQG